MNLWVNIVIVFVALAVIVTLLRKKTAQRSRQPYRPYSGQGKIRRSSNPEDQLYFVTQSNFTKKRLMNPGEYALFKKVENYLLEEHPRFRVFPQVCLGEILKSDNDDAFRSINSKRFDLTIIDPKGEPVIVLEYQGSGHHQGTHALRDAVKREVCRKADIRFIEVGKDHNPNFLPLISIYIEAYTSAFLARTAQAKNIAQITVQQVPLE